MRRSARRVLLAHLLLLALLFLAALAQAESVERDGDDERRAGDDDNEEDQGGEDVGAVVDINEEAFVEAGAVKKRRRIAGVDFDRLDAFKSVFGDAEHERVFRQYDADEDRVLCEAEFREMGCDLPRWIAYYDRDGDGVLGPSEFIPWFRERYLWLDALEAGALEGDAPPGHWRQLGEHAPAAEQLAVDVIEGAMPPRTFWRTHVEGHRPALFRGVEAQSVAVKRWADEGFLREHYGGVDLKIESKIEDRGEKAKQAAADAVGHRMNMSQYLTRNHGANIYAVSILPQQMAWDCNIVPAVLCGGRRAQVSVDTGQLGPHPYPHPAGHDWLTHIYEANLWIAHGRTRSQLHYDKENNMNCLYVGEKQWILMDTRAYFKKLLWARGGKYSSKSDLLNAGTDWVPIEVDGVDMRVHRKMADVPFYQFTQKAGDCVFLPYSMLHYVNKTNPGLQVAMSYMWVPQDKYDEEACEAVPLVSSGAAHVPMAAFDILWYYNGSGIIPQGYPDPEVEIIQEIEPFIRRANNGGFLSREVLQQWVDDGLSANKHKLPEFWAKFHSYAKRDPARGLHQSELRWPNVPLELWTKFAAEFDQQGGLECDRGRQYNPRPAEEWSKMGEVLRSYEQNQPFRHSGFDTAREAALGSGKDEL